jgi:hypothetical protein
MTPASHILQAPVQGWPKPAEIMPWSVATVGNGDDIFWWGRLIGDLASRGQACATAGLGEMKGNAI